VERGEQFFHTSSNHHVSLPYSRTVLTITRYNLANDFFDTRASGPWRRQPIASCALITNTRRKIMVILREDPSQIAKLRHPHSSSPTERGVGRRPQRPWPWFAVSYCRCGKLRPLVLRHARGFDVLQAKFAFVRSSVAIETESLVVMSELKMRAQFARFADQLTQRDRAFHHLVVASQGTSKCRGPVVQVRVIERGWYKVQHFRCWLAMWFEGSMLHRFVTDYTLSSTVSLAAYITGSPLVGGCMLQWCAGHRKFGLTSSTLSCSH
jgi:hypothetical protein